VANESAGEKRVTVNPYFSVATDAADLKADLVGVPDKHDRWFCIIAWVSI